VETDPPAAVAVEAAVDLSEPDPDLCDRDPTSLPVRELEGFDPVD